MKDRRKPNELLQNRGGREQIPFLTGLSNIADAFSCVRVVISGSVLTDMNLAMADALNLLSAQ